MKTLFVVFALLAFPCLAYPDDVRAKTSDGKEVVLHADGTWTYAAEAGKAKKAKPNYSGKRGFFSLYAPDKVWKRSNEPLNEDAEVSFVNREETAWAVVIAEQTQVPLPALKKIVIDQWKTVDPDAKVVLDKVRVINGREFLCLKCELEAEGIPFAFYGCYYACTAGTLQVVAWCGQNVFEELKPDLDRFFDSVEVNEKK